MSQTTQSDEKIEFAESEKKRLDFVKFRLKKDIDKQTERQCDIEYATGDNKNDETIQ